MEDFLLFEISMTVQFDKLLLHPCKAAFQAKPYQQFVFLVVNALD